MLNSFLLYQIYFATLTNSIIPLIDKYENISNLPIQKYSQNQYQEIVLSLRQKENKIRLISYNTLFKFLDSDLEDIKRWSNRLPKILELIEEIHPDIIAFQELMPDQLDDLLPYLKGQFSYYAEPNPQSDQELNLICYRKDRFEILDQKVWTLSTIPYVVKMTMIELKDLKTGNCFAVYNTHLCFENIDQRDLGARTIAKLMHHREKKIPVVLAGDMNTFPQRLDMPNLPAYDGDYINHILTKNGLKNARDQSILGHLGPLATFTNSGDDPTPFVGTGTPGVFLDNIYVSDDIKVLMHAVQPAKVNGYFPSDHMPIIIDFYLEKGSL